jgi:hypothetical protein
MAGDMIRGLANLVGLDRIMQWIGTTMRDEYGVTEVEVIKLDNSVVLKIKANSREDLSKIERAARRGLGMAGVMRKRLDIKVER